MRQCLHWQRASFMQTQEGYYMATLTRGQAQKLQAVPTSRYIDDMLGAYMAAALWSSCDFDGNPLDENYCADDIDADTVQSMRDDCEDFATSNIALLIACGISAESAGHDFWLTRNGHGTGFWDRGHGAHGQALTKAAKVYGACDLYITDDNKVAT